MSFEDTEMQVTSYKVSRLTQHLFELYYPKVLAYKDLITFMVF